jgi:hypothetical protein
MGIGEKSISWLLEQIPGAGRKTLAHLRVAGIHTVQDMATCNISIIKGGRKLPLIQAKAKELVEKDVHPEEVRTKIDEKSSIFTVNNTVVVETEKEEKGELSKTCFLTMVSPSIIVAANILMSFETVQELKVTMRHEDMDELLSFGSWCLLQTELEQVNLMVIAQRTLKRA